MNSKIKETKRSKKRLVVIAISFIISHYFIQNWDDFVKGIFGQPEIEKVEKSE